MKRRSFLSVVLIGLLAVAAAGRADTTVYVTDHGHKYHTHRDCIALRNAKPEHVHTVQLSSVHGLDLCGICARRKPAK